MAVLGVTCGMIFVACLTVILGLGRVCRWCPVVTDVLVSPSSVVTEVCDGSSLGSDWEFVEPQSFFFFLQTAFVCLCGESRTNELRRDASESASEYQKKVEAAHATAKFTFIDR